MVNSHLNSLLLGSFSPCFHIPLFAGWIQIFPKAQIICLYPCWSRSECQECNSGLSCWLWVLLLNQHGCKQFLFALSVLMIGSFVIQLLFRFFTIVIVCIMKDSKYPLSSFCVYSSLLFLNSDYFVDVTRSNIFYSFFYFIQQLPELASVTSIFKGTKRTRLYIHKTKMGDTDPHKREGHKISPAMTAQEISLIFLLLCFFIVFYIFDHWFWFSTLY